MSASNEKSRSHKSKISLQKKFKLDIPMVSNQLNDTSDFRSVGKMQKFVSGVTVPGRNTRKGKSTKRALVVDDKKNVKSQKEVTIQKVEGKCEILAKDVKLNKINVESAVVDCKTRKELETVLDEVKEENSSVNVEVTKEEVKDVIEIDCDEEETKGTCLACGNDYGSQEMQAHVQICLKARFQRGSTKDNDKQSDQEVKTEEDCFFCQICQKDLSRVNSKRRTQHLNRCMDKEDEDKKVKELEKKALEDAKLAVLDCPMCGRPCKTDNARKVHVKKCGQKLGVTTDQVLKLMKKQEEEHQMLIAAGVLPKSALNKLQNKSSSSTVLAKTKKVAKEPKSQFDADLQMAIAMSMSENKAVEKTVKEPKKGRKQKGLVSVTGQKGSREPSLLVALTDEEKKRRLSQRVSNMLVPQEEDEVMDLTPKFADSNIENKYSTENTQIPKLWHRCNLQEENKENSKKDLFYVECLVPPIEVSKVITGSKVRRMSEIPGRETSFIMPKTPMKMIRNQTTMRGSLPNDSGTPEDTMVASTQTAVLLAELAADSTQTSTDLTQTSSPGIDCSGFCPEQPLSVQPKQTPSLIGLQNSMLTMVNNPTLSDLKIHAAGGDTVFCHKVVLSCRCPTLLKEEENGEIALRDISTDSVVSLMMYVYGGQISVTESSLKDLLMLANRFDLSELLVICKELQTNLLPNSPEKLKISQSKMSVESLLKQLWSDSEESEEDEELCKEDLIDEVQDQTRGSDNRIVCSQNSLIISHQLIENMDAHISSEDCEEENNMLINKTSLKCKTKLPLEKNIPSRNKPLFKKQRSGSLIFENDELEIYSNASSSIGNTQEKNDKNAISGSICRATKTVNSNDNLMNFKESPVSLDEKSVDLDFDECLDTIEKSPGNLDENVMNLDNSGNFMNVDENSSNIDENVIKLDDSGNLINIDENLSNVDENAMKLHVDDERENSPELPVIGISKKDEHINSFDSSFDQLDLTSSLTNIENLINTEKNGGKNVKNISLNDNENYLPVLRDSHKYKFVGENGNKNDNTFDYVETKQLCRDESPRKVRKEFKERKNKTELSPPSKNSNIQNSSKMDERYDESSSDDLIIIDEDSRKQGSLSSKDDLDNLMTGECENEIDLQKRTTGEELADKTFDSDTGFNTSLNISGGDLFASPSPTIQSKKIKQNVISKEPPVLEENFQDSISYIVSPAFRKSKRKTFERDSTRTNYQLPKKLKLDEEDVLIIGDNMSELSQENVLSSNNSQSPKYKQTEKKKWKFTSKVNIMKNSDITFSGSMNSDYNSSLNDQCNHNTHENSVDDNVHEKQDINRSAVNFYTNVIDTNSEKSESEDGAEKSVDDDLDDSGFNLTQSVIRKSIGGESENDDGNYNDEINLIDEKESEDERKQSDVTVQYNMTATMATDDDVWDDFDDCGGGVDGFDGIVPYVTPAKSQSQVAESVEGIVVSKDNNPNEDSYIQPDAPKEFENLTFCEEASFYDVDVANPSSSVKSTFKTPTMSKEEKRKLKQNWVEPSPFTPMPNFDTMDTPQIKKKVQSYGVKPVGKKRMIKLLTDIYQKTHQYETDSELEDDTEERCKKNTEVKNEDDKEEEEEEEDLDNSHESQYSDLIEESLFQSTEDESQPLKPGEKDLEEKLMDFLKHQPDIQIRILMYEPLELEILKQKITEAGIKVSMDKLKEFLDEKCITFTMKNMRKSPRKKRRSPKKRKSKEQDSPAKSPSKGRGRGKKKLNPC